jgi:cell division protein FtsB
MNAKEKEEFQKLQAEADELKQQVHNLRNEREEIVAINTKAGDVLKELEAENTALKTELENERKLHQVTSAQASQVLEANGNLRAALATKSPEQLKAERIRAQVCI